MAPRYTSLTQAISDRKYNTNKILEIFKYIE